MTNHRNGLSGLSAAGAARQSAIVQGALSQGVDAELAHFSFQPYSEGSDTDPVRINANRRARLDKRLLEEVYEHIATQDHLETRDILLHAYHGTVTIEGCVADRAMRAQIGNFIRRCPFVKAVINRIRTRDTSDEHAETYGRHRAIAA